ncbi:MAG: DUF2182 domain-containing protein [Burkholderiales bacterium]
MGEALGPFLAGWTPMMAVMMLPSAAPMIRVFRLVAADAPNPSLRMALFVMGYLLVWAAVGIPAWGLGVLLMDLGAPVAQVTAVTLIAAGVYQLTPLKDVCLRACRTPMDFLVTHWYPGSLGAVRLGVEHGLYCVGCCWGLMAAFVLVGAMSLSWLAAVAALVFAEKVLPRGALVGRAAGFALIAAGILVLARPDLAMPAR